MGAVAPSVAAVEAGAPGAAAGVAAVEAVEAGARGSAAAVAVAVARWPWRAVGVVASVAGVKLTNFPALIPHWVTHTHTHNKKSEKIGMQLLLYPGCCCRISCHWTALCYANNECGDYWMLGISIGPDQRRSLSRESESRVNNIWIRMTSGGESVKSETEKEWTKNCFFFLFFFFLFFI